MSNSIAPETETYNDLVRDFEDGTDVGDDG